MRNSNKILVFLLVFSGIFAISNKDIVAAVKRAKAKRVIPKKKVNTVSSDATVTSRAGRTTTTTTTTSTTTAVDEDTEASLLAGNLKVCITSACDGDVAFEKCFKKGQAEYFVRADTTCKAMYDKASSDVVRLKAINNLNSTIKTYFNDACESAGGKVSGDVCKVKVCYVAKGEDTSDLKNCSDYKIGQSFTCSYTAFGFSDQDMEYKTKMTTEQLGQVINASMGLVQGALSTTVSIVDAVSASKELKAKNDIKGKECYGIWTYGSNTLSITPSSNCKKTWTKQENKKACTDDKSKICKTDTYGNWYEETDNTLDSNKTYTDLKTEQDKSCDTVDVSKWGNTDSKIQKCYVELSEYTELTKAEKEAELYKKFTDFNKLKIKDAAASYGQAIFLNKTFGGDKTTSSDKYAFVFDSKSANDTACQAEASSKYKNTVNVGSCKMTNQSQNCPLYGDNYNDCMKKHEYKKYEVSCSCDTKTSTTNTVSFIDNDTGEFDDEAFSRFEEGLAKTSSNNYSSAVSTYNSKMKSVDEKKDEITELKSRKSSGIANAIATGSSTLMQQGTALTTTLISVDKNKGVRTGACYLGDPSSGGIYFAPENSRKTLSWKNL